VFVVEGLIEGLVEGLVEGFVEGLVVEVFVVTDSYKGTKANNTIKKIFISYFTQIIFIWF